jgi:hypothetical protein
MRGSHRDDPLSHVIEAAAVMQCQGLRQTFLQCLKEKVEILPSSMDVSRNPDTISWCCLTGQQPNTPFLAQSPEPFSAPLDSKGNHPSEHPIVVWSKSFYEG